MPSNLSSAVFALARAAGLKAVCSAYGGYNFPGGDGFHLHRCHGDAKLCRLKNTLTLDPRQMAKRPIEGRRRPGLDEEVLGLFNRGRGPLCGRTSPVIPLPDVEIAGQPPCPAPRIA